jgi:hypothetical protein
MPTIVHFDLPADDLERAKTFYEKLFDWKFELLPTPMPYYFIETTDLNGNPGAGGGMSKRQSPEEQVSNPSLTVSTPFLRECLPFCPFLVRKSYLTV